MATMLDYIKKYGNKTFEEKEFNDIDNMIFASISYSNFEGIVSPKKKYIRLESACKKFLKKYNIKTAAKLGIAIKDSYKVINEIYKTPRYKDVLMYSYSYEFDINKQFSAVCFKINKKLTYIAFEGTDNLLSGWKEDCEMAYRFPVAAHKHAISYLNENISIFDNKIIVGGHSKGGNLALVASMYCNPIKKRKIIKVYSNDGTGLRLNEIKSKEYASIEDRLISIIPNYSIVGLLLRHTHNYKVIKSNRRDLMAHSLLTWQVEDDKLKPAELSEFSKKLDRSINIWLDEHDDEQRKNMTEEIFGMLEKSGVKNLYDIKNIKVATTIIKNLNTIDDTTKNLFINFLTFNLKYVLFKEEE